MDRDRAQKLATALTMANQDTPPAERGRISVEVIDVTAATPNYRVVERDPRDFAKTIEIAR